MEHVAEDPLKKYDESTEETTQRTYNIITIDTALERIGYGNFQRRVLIAAGLCSASDAMEILMLSFLSVEVGKDWELTKAQQQALFSVVFGGALIGTLILGRLGDLWGRRTLFLGTAATVAAGGILSSICQKYWQLTLCRAIVGIGIGGVMIPFDTYGEILPPSRRGQGLTLPSYFWTTGSLLVVLVARMTTPYWRWLCLWCAIPCIVATIVGYYVVPESPHWLVAIGQPSRALHILRQAAKQNGLDPEEVLPANITLTSLEKESINNQVEEISEDTAILVSQPSIPIWEILDKKQCCEIFILMVVWFGYALLYYATVLIITDVFKSDEVFDYQAIAIAALAEIAATTILICTIDRWGRKFVHALFFGLGGILIMGLGWQTTTTMYDGNHDEQNKERNGLIVLSFFGRLCIFAGSAVTWIWTAEIITTQLRTTGHSWANAGGRVGGILAPYLVDSSQYSYQSIGVVMFCICWIISCLAWGTLPETCGKSMGSHAEILPLSGALELKNQNTTKDTRDRRGYERVNSGAK